MNNFSYNEAHALALAEAVENGAVVVRTSTYAYLGHRNPVTLWVRKERMKRPERIIGQTSPEGLVQVRIQIIWDPSLPEGVFVEEHYGK